MILYRLSTAKWAKDISGEGSRLFGGRFNPKGMAALYTSENISLCILEILVRASKITIPDDYTLITLEIPETKIDEIHLKKLKKDWASETQYTQGIGEDFLKNNAALCLKVPSAIVPLEHNFILNPAHKEFKKVSLQSTELLLLDKRLFKI